MITLMLLGHIIIKKDAKNICFQNSYTKLDKEKLMLCISAFDGNNVYSLKSKFKI